MLFLTESLLKAAGFRYDDTEEIWEAPVRLPPVVATECDGDGPYIMEALLEIHSVLQGCGCSYRNFAVSGSYLTLVGLTAARLAAVA